MNLNTLLQIATVLTIIVGVVILIIGFQLNKEANRLKRLKKNRNMKENNDVIKVAEKLYYEINPETKRDVPSSIYELVEKWSKEWRQTDQSLSLYDWIKLNKK